MHPSNDLPASSLNMAGNNLLHKFVKKKRPGSQTSVLETEQRFFDIESVCNFLEYQGIQFLEEDVVYILKDFGISGSRITLQLLEKFMDSSLWN